MRMQTPHATVDFYFLSDWFFTFVYHDTAFSYNCTLIMHCLMTKGINCHWLPLFCSSPCFAPPPPHPLQCMCELFPSKNKTAVHFIHCGPSFSAKSETANLFLFLVVYIYFASEVVVGCPLDPASRLDSEIQSWSMGNSLLTVSHWPLQQTYE